jgi:hypothetical protein
MAFMKNNQFSLDPQLVHKVSQRIDPLLTDPAGLPNGKSKRKHLTDDDATKLTKALIEAVGHASVFAASGPLANRIPGRGRPPDNSVFIFIDDIMRACEAAGLKPGLRYVKPESLPVRIYKELAPLIWPGATKAPRRLFERWQRHRDDLIRA